jgi:hypothetical protein
MATKKKAQKVDVWPTVVKGSHLTVYTYEDGRTKLEWDDDALLNEIREATKTVKSAVKAKSVRKKKSA